MIVEFVQFTYPPGPTREQILDDARTTIPRWRGNKELIRKHYIVGEDGSGGAFYIWPSKEAAQRGHNAEWVANMTYADAALMKNGVGDTDKAEFLGLFERYRGDIVEID